MSDQTHNQGWKPTRGPMEHAEIKPLVDAVNAMIGEQEAPYHASFDLGCVQVWPNTANPVQFPNAIAPTRAQETTLFEAISEVEGWDVGDMHEFWTVTPAGTPIGC
jgi:hypothetical protein